MARRRFRRKDLKRPDEFVSHGWELLTWASENSRNLSWGLTGLVVLAIVVGGFSSLRSARVRQANEDLGQALGEFRGGHYAEAATQLSDVASRWQSTAVGHLATLYAANADLKSDNIEGATKLLQDLAARRNWPPYLQQEVLVDFGVALERKGDKAGAASRYEDAAGLDGPFVGIAILDAARCREELGEKDKARDLYQRFTHDFPDAPQTEQVTAKLQELAAAS